MGARDSLAVTLRALWDGRTLKSGAEDAADAIDKLAATTDDASDRMRRSLASVDDGVSSTFGPSGSFSHAADDVERSGGKLKAAGSEIGGEFAENIGEGIRSGDIGGTVLETFTSLGPALGVAGIGLALGAGLINGILKGAAEKRQQAIDAITSIFDSVEVKARESNARIRQDILGTFDFSAVTKALGGSEGPAAGFRKITAEADRLHVPWADLYDVLRNNITPQNSYILRLLREQAAETRTSYAVKGQQVQLATAEARKAQELLDYQQRTRAAQRDSLDLLKGGRDALDHAASAAERRAAAEERSAAAVERYAAAYRRVTGRTLPHADQVNNA